MGSITDLLDEKDLVLIWDDERSIWISIVDINQYQGLTLGEFVAVIGYGYVKFDLFADIDGKHVQLSAEDVFDPQTHCKLYITNKTEFRRQKASTRTPWPIIGCIIAMIALPLVFVYSVVYSKGKTRENTKMVRSETDSSINIV